MTRRVASVVAMLLVASLAAVVVPGGTAEAEDASRFVDVASDHLFSLSVEWLADQGITKGCNPSEGNTMFCPDKAVTRGQMASFLARALYLPAYDGPDRFADDNHSVHETDIEKLAAAGITKGCNPSEGNTRFCPDKYVTRGQMAAFLSRAFSYSERLADPFSDDDGSIFEADIERLAAAGVTKGCNPAEGNTRFCPDRFVTRGQMAAFLHRAFGSPAVGEPGVNRIDPGHTLLPDASDVAFITLNPDGQSKLTYSGRVDVGDVIVMGITPETPEGFLGKVVSEGGGQITTEPGSLLDAIPEIDFQGSFDLEAEPAGVAGVGSFFSQGFTCGGNPITLDVDGEFDPGHLVIDFQWSWFNLKRFEVGWHDTETDIDINASAGAAVSCTKTFATDLAVLPIIAFSVGPVPVVIVPKAGMDVDLTASVQGGIELDSGVAYTYQGGLLFEDGAWSPYWKPDLTVKPVTTGLTAGGAVEIEARPSLSTDLYGVFGPNFSVGPFLDLSADITDDPWWTLDGGLAVQMGIDLDVWVLQLAHDVSKFRPISLRLAQASDDPPPAPLGIETAALPDATVGEEYSVQLQTSGGTPPIQWKLVSGTLPDGLTLDAGGEITGIPTIAGTADFEVKATDSGSATDTTLLRIEVANAFEPPAVLLRVATGAKPLETVLAADEWNDEVIVVRHSDSYVQDIQLRKYDSATGSSISTPIPVSLPEEFDGMALGALALGRGTFAVIGERSSSIPNFDRCAVAVIDSEGTIGPVVTELWSGAYDCRAWSTLGGIIASPDNGSLIWAGRKHNELDQNDDWIEVRFYNSSDLSLAATATIPGTPDVRDTLEGSISVHPNGEVSLLHWSDPFGSAAYVSLIHARPGGDDLYETTEIRLEINDGQACAAGNGTTHLWVSEWVGSDHYFQIDSGSVAVAPSRPGSFVCASRGDGITYHLGRASTTDNLYSVDPDGNILHTLDLAVGSIDNYDLLGFDSRGIWYAGGGGLDEGDVILVGWGER